MITTTFLQRLPSSQLLDSSNRQISEDGLQAIDHVRRGNRCIILSPHLDDAALSCGGLAAELAGITPVEVWTIFAGAPVFGPYSPLARWFHDISGGSSGARLASKRRREDIKACRVISAKPRHFKWFDAVYRRTSSGEPLYQNSRQVTWHPEDDIVVATIAAALLKNLRFDDVLLVPLGIGLHVDHLIVRAAAERLDRLDLTYYVDVPYIRTYPQELAAQTSGMTKQLYRISPRYTSAWIASVMAYETQIKMLEEAVGSLPSLITELSESGMLSLYKLND
jgi:LmbE family N-acetylglucosaminyl deacetylase